MSYGARFLSVPNFGVYVFRLDVLSAPEQLADTWSAFLTANPEASRFHQLGDFRRLSGIISPDAMAPVRELRDRLLQDLGVSPGFQPRRVCLTVPGPGGEAFFDSYRLIQRLPHLIHSTNVSDAWAKLVPDAPIPAGVRRFLD